MLLRIHISCVCLCGVVVITPNDCGYMPTTTATAAISTEIELIILAAVLIFAVWRAGLASPEFNVAFTFFIDIIPRYILQIHKTCLDVVLFSYIKTRLSIVIELI